ncbi:hypothetical protein K4F52_005242 [Lecanicillium sp. MT-2017a]|nr:hypothetical protein K4F52_005242 [Lecanicillium sp. MT-2017a]
MGAKLPSTTRPFNMRSSAIRSLFIAVCLTLVLATLVRHGAVTVPNLMQTSSFKSSGVHSQQSVGEQLAPGLASNDSEGGARKHFNMDCSADVNHLSNLQSRFELGNRFQYMKRYVRFTRTEGLQRKSMTHTAQSLLPKSASFGTVDMQNGVAPDGTCLNPIDVPVPKSGLAHTVNASDYIFGVSTTYKRFMEPETTPINEWTFWLTDGHGHSNGGKLLLMLMDATDQQLQEAANLLGDVGIDVDVYHSDATLEMAVRYLTLVPTLYTHPEAKNKKWLVTCDDDTFFPSMHGLIEKMNEFNHTREMYIGTLSEDTGAIERHGSQAFGGAGVFLSLPMGKKITDLYNSCTTEEKIKESDSGWGPQGDILLRKCIYENTETRLTTMPALWQLDILGHPSGFYESGIKPLSLHHYRGGGWHKAYPGLMAKLAYGCGEDCTMMRFQTPDDFIISGYSIAHYPKGITFDTNQVEATLHAAPEDKGWNLDFKLGPQRPSLLETGRKIAWELEEAVVASDGSVVQTYIRKQNDDRWKEPDGSRMSNIDGVIELVWIPK